MRWLLVLSTLLLPVAAQAHEIGTYRELIANVWMQLVKESVWYEVQKDSDSALGPSDGPWAEIISAAVNDPAPAPSGFALGGASQATDVTFSDGVWTVGGSGFAFADSAVNYGEFVSTNGTNADGYAYFAANVTVDRTTLARLDAEISSTFERINGIVTPTHLASVSVCRVGGTCEVNLSVTDQVVDLTTAKLSYHDALDFSTPGVYRLRFSAEAYAYISPLPAASEGVASWSGTLTVPEPGAALLGTVALLVLAVMRETRRQRRPG
jgi:hypothetical protein